MPLRRIAPAAIVAALVAVLAVVLAGPSGADPGTRPLLVTVPARPAVPPGPLLLAARARDRVVEPVIVAGAGFREALAAQRARARAHARTVELRHLRRSRTVRAALRRMWLSGAIDRPRYERARSVLWRARQTALRLRGPRAVELRRILGLPGRLAARRLLTSSRLPLVLLTVQRNARYWALRPIPRPGQRVTFGSDPVVFRYEAGQGLHVHMLSTAGRVNGMARDCLYDRSHCNRRALRRALGRLTAIASRRGGFVAWESLYRWGDGAPPWVSAMTQGTAIQALARGGSVLHERRWLRVARRALGAFETPPPVGVGVRAPGGRQYLMYSFAPHMRILNGFLQAITGLHDLAVLSGSRRARRLFARGDRAARAVLPRFDTGAWSLYLQGGHETDLGYHELTTAFLRNLCRRTSRRAYCRTARRFAHYEREPPAIGVARAGRLRAGRAVALRFAVSKVSDVRVAVGGPAGTVVLRSGRFARGAYAAGWTPRRAGVYRLRIVARGLSGHVAVAVRRLSVRTAPRRHHRHHHGRRSPRA